MMMMMIPPTLILNGMNSLCRLCLGASIYFNRMCNIIFFVCLLSNTHPRRSGEKAGRKFSSKCKRVPGYRLSPNYFKKFKRMPAPD